MMVEQEDDEQYKTCGPNTNADQTLQNQTPGANSPSSETLHPSRISKKKKKTKLTHTPPPKSVVIPCVAIASVNAYGLWLEHWEHKSHEPPREEQPEFAYQNIRTKNFFWGNGDEVKDFFLCPLSSFSPLVFPLPPAVFLLSLFLSFSASSADVDFFASSRLFSGTQRSTTTRNQRSKLPAPLLCVN